MRNMKDEKTKIYPSTTRGGKELPSSSPLDSPFVLSRLATPPPAINSDMLQVVDDTTYDMNDASTLLNETVPLGEFLDEQLAKAKELKNVETVEIYDSPIRPSSHRIEMPLIPEGYVVGEEITRELLACNGRDDVKKLLCKLKEKYLNARMKYDPKFVTSPIMVTVKGYGF